MANPYQVLGVSISDDDETIKHAYRRLCKEAHPDKGGSEERMAELNEAYALIGDPDKRREFDRSHSWLSEFDLYASVLGRPTVARDFKKKPTARTAVNGSDIHLTVNIPFSVFINGCRSMPVEFERRSTCLECDGTGAKQASRCGMCAGEGRVRDSSTRRFRKCLKCNGTGLNILEKCPHCNGGETHRKVRRDIVYTPGMLDTVVQGRGNCGRNGGCNGNLVITFKPELPEMCSVDDGVLTVKGVEVYPEDLVLGKWIEIVFGHDLIRVRIPPNTGTTVIETVTGTGLRVRVPVTLVGCSSDGERGVYEKLRSLHEGERT